MKKSSLLRTGTLLSLTLGAALAVGLAIVSGCGDGDGEVRVEGKVVLLLGDAPAVSAKEVWITVKEASLIPEAAGASPVILYESASGLRLNILEYADEDFVFTVRDDVPPGRYSKIRLRISKVEAVGGPCESVEVLLPSGRLDLTARGPFAIEPGGKISVRLDLDAKKSILLHPAGQSGKCIFRPVAFSDIAGIDVSWRCAHPVRGKVTDLVTDPSGAITRFDLDLPGARGTIEVVVSTSTAIFESCERVSSRAIEVGDEIVARGRFDSSGRFRAFAILIGQPILLRGTIDELTSGGFILDPAEGEEILEPIAVEIADEALIFTACETPVSLSALREGAEVWVAGWISGSPAQFCAALVHVRHVPLSGELTAIRSSSGGYLLTFDPYGAAPPVNVFLPSGAPVRLERDGEISPAVLSDLLRCRRLPALLRLDPTVAGFRALEVVVQAEEVAGEVLSIGANSRLIDVGGTMVQLQPDSRILDVSSLQPSPIPIEEIRPGYEVRVFGLSRCMSGAVEFVGFLALLEKRG